MAVLKWVLGVFLKKNFLLRKEKVCSIFNFLILNQKCLFILESRKEKEKWGKRISVKRNISRLPPRQTLTWNWTHHLLVYVMSQTLNQQSPLARETFYFVFVGFVQKKESFFCDNLPILFSGNKFSLLTPFCTFIWSLTLSSVTHLPLLPLKLLYKF